MDERFTAEEDPGLEEEVSDERQPRRAVVAMAASAVGLALILGSLPPAFASQSPTAKVAALLAASRGALSASTVAGAAAESAATGSVRASEQAPRPGMALGASAWQLQSLLSQPLDSGSSSKSGEAPADGRGEGGGDGAGAGGSSAPAAGDAAESAEKGGGPIDGAASAGGIPAPTSAGATSSPGVSGEAAVDPSALLELVNAERAAAGLSPVSWDQRLVGSAQQRAREIALSYGHNRPNGSPFHTALPARALTQVGENIGVGYDSAGAIHSAWIASEGHRRNILYPNFRSMAAATVMGSDGHRYWVELFTASV